MARSKSVFCFSSEPGGIESSSSLREGTTRGQLTKVTARVITSADNTIIFNSINDSTCRARAEVRPHTPIEFQCGQRQRIPPAQLSQRFSCANEAKSRRAGLRQSPGRETA